jgi:hypothetical protein
LATEVKARSETKRTVGAANMVGKFWEKNLDNMQTKSLAKTNLWILK